MRDLGLSYEQAAHGVQSAIRFEMSKAGVPDEGQDAVIRMLKHLRVGVDMRAADTLGLAKLLMDKRVITKEEYVEQMRLAANEELARYEEHMRAEYNVDLSFR
jgi:hypothetical protein